MGLALEESVQEDEDQVERQNGVSIVFEKKLISHIENKIIDYQLTPAEGFVITTEGPNPCGDCSC